MEVNETSYCRRHGVCNLRFQIYIEIYLLYHLTCLSYFIKMNAFKHNNIPISDILAVLEQNEMVWKTKVGSKWPASPLVELILDVSTKANLSPSVRYSAIRYIKP